ncbi:MAG: hypothetical protein ABIO70_30355 [Pseudomonadota bacterium]
MRSPFPVPSWAEPAPGPAAPVTRPSFYGYGARAGFYGAAREAGAHAALAVLPEQPIARRTGPGPSWGLTVLLMALSFLSSAAFLRWLGILGHPSRPALTRTD